MFFFEKNAFWRENTLRGTKSEKKCTLSLKSGEKLSITPFRRLSAEQRQR